MLNFEVEARRQTDPEKKVKKIEHGTCCRALEAGWGKESCTIFAADVVAILTATLRCHTARSLRSTVPFVERSHSGPRTSRHGAGEIPQILDFYG